MQLLNNHINPSPQMGYHANEVPLLHSVDCVIFGFQRTELRVLLVRFPYEPFKGHWSLIGGFVQPHLDMELSARLTVQHMTGLPNVYMEQVHTFGGINRVPSERVITTCYYALINAESVATALSDEFGATWFDINHLPALVYDHAHMLAAALQKLREKVRRQPIGFELLPEKFTMYQLLKLYEAILGKPLDKRNFHKKILKMNLLHRLDETDTSHSKRAAQLVRFDADKYQQLLQEGFLFDL